jgi:hypothetical protein
MEYFFKSFTGEPEPKSLIFTMKDMVFELNIKTEKIIPIHEFKNVNMDLPPIHFECTNDQQKFVIASMYDGIWVNSYTGVEHDLDKLFGVTSIKFILHDEEDKCFYMLCNKRLKSLPGVYEELKVAEIAQKLGIPMTPKLAKELFEMDFKEDIE